jgi:hypothetical protein
MNLPDFPNTGYRTIKPEMLAGSAWKFLPTDWFFTPTSQQADIRFFSRILPLPVHSPLLFFVILL